MNLYAYMRNPRTDNSMGKAWEGDGSVVVGINRREKRDICNTWSNKDKILKIKMRIIKYLPHRVIQSIKWDNEKWKEYSIECVTYFIYLIITSPTPFFLVQILWINSDKCEARLLSQLIWFAWYDLGEYS